MTRRRFTWVGSMVTAMTAAIIGGCAMCDDTCDHSSPVIDSTVDGQCPMGARAGSAISGTVPTTTVPGDGVVVEQ